MALGPPEQLCLILADGSQYDMDHSGQLSPEEGLRFCEDVVKRMKQLGRLTLTPILILTLSLNNRNLYLTLTPILTLTLTLTLTQS